MYSRRQTNKRAIPDEDKQSLSDLGFDVAAYLGEGLFSFVFNGVCNAMEGKEWLSDPMK